MPDSRTKIISGSEAQMGEEWTWTDFSETLGFFSFSPFLLRVPNDDCAAESDSEAISSWIWADTEREWYHREDIDPIAGTSEASQCWGCTLLWASHSWQSKRPHHCIAQDYLYVECKDLILHKGVFGTSSFLDKFPICFQAQFQYHLRKNSSVLIRSNITPFSSIFSWQFQHPFIIPLNHITRS